MMKILLVMAILFTQLNLTMTPSNASTELFLSTEQTALKLDEYINISISGLSTTEQETIIMNVPQGLSFDLERTMLSNNLAGVHIQYNEATQQVEIQKTATTDTEVMDAILLSFKATQAGANVVEATSTDSELISNQVSLTVMEQGEAASNPVSDELLEDHAMEEKKVQQPQEKVISEANQPSTRLGNEVDVSDWTAFGNAIKDPNVSKINIVADFSNTTNDSVGIRTTQITRDLEINGNGHRVDFQNASIYLGNPGTATPTFHMHDIVLAQRYLGAYSEDIVGSRLSSFSGKWRYVFGNIVTEASVQRLARAQNAEVRLYGNLNLDTRGENFYTGSMIIDPNTNYIGNVNTYNFSVIWYNTSAGAADTGSSREFTVGDGAKLRLGQTQTSGVAYPAVYHHYKDITIGENAVYNVAMPGNAVRFDDNNSSFTAKKGSIVNLTSKQASGAVVSYQSNNNIFTVEPGAFFYTIGVSNQALINLRNTTQTGNQFILDNPAQYDIRNLGNNSASYAVGLGTTNIVDNQFTINNSDIDLWGMGVEVLGPSTLTYALVGQLDVKGNGTRQTVTSTEPALQSQFKTNLYRRIAGMNQIPEVEFSPVTDADLTVTARVKIGMVPDNNGADIDGNVKYVPVYASANQATVTITEPNGQIKTLSTNKDGYVQYTLPDFYQADDVITGAAVRGPHIGENTTITVEDVTPPAIAEIPRKVIPFDRTIKGINGEPGAVVTYTVNGVEAKDGGETIKTTVNPDGTWEIKVLDSKVVIGDKLQFFLEDTLGNKNPIVDTKFKDATFKAGTILTVQDGDLTFVSAPQNLKFGDELEIVSMDKTYPLQELDKKLTIQDTRVKKSEWQLTAKMTTVLTSTSGKELPQAIHYKLNGVDKTINTASNLIYRQQNTNEDPFNLSDMWHPTDNGLFLVIKAGEARAEAYTGTIEWSLENVPANK